MSVSDPLPSSTLPASRRGGWADAGVAGLVLLFALAAGSFVARNSDLWLHLAAGRLIAAGDYRFGADPFATTSAGHYWANHAWLFDLGFYEVFHHLGGAALVALKAAAVAATAGTMLLIARGRTPEWVAAGCVLLAVLAMTPRLLVQPAVASYLLLAGCVYCLQAGGRSLRLVPVLVALWVNVDGWFLLGPLLVGLFALGRRIDPDRGRLDPWPAWLVPATLAACLASPHHVRALTPPPELSPAVWASAFPADPRLAGFFASPWQLAPLGPAGGYNLAAAAFFVLLALGAASFALNRRALRTWRGPVWLAFAALAAWQARLIPFFAVVAGPITAINMGEVVPVSFVRPGRVLAVVLGVLLVALGWYGKLTGFHNRDRGAAWGVHADPTLERAARVVAEWRRTPADAPLFTAHPDVGHYLAWFAPGERGFLDSRLTLFTGVAADYRDLSRVLGLLPGEESTERFPAERFAGVLVYDPDPRRMTAALRELGGGRWHLMRVAGGAVLAVPRERPTPALLFDPEWAVFVGGSDVGPADVGPASMTGAVSPWEVRRLTGRRGSWEADAGTVYLRLFDDAANRSPALPLLALRAGRRGAEIDPGDATAWLVAGRAALALDTRAWEHETGDTLSPLAFVRHVATAGALVQAVRLNPDSVAAHETLAGVYARRGFLDLAHRHAAEANRLAARAGEGAGRLADLAAETERLVQDAENLFLVRTVGLAGDPFARARTAAELGLPQKGIEVLVAAHPDLYGAAGLGLLADLLLQTGYAAEARTLLDRDELRLSPAALGLFTLPGRTTPGAPAWAYRLPAYDWYDLCQCAAAGRYPGAAAAVDRIQAHLAAEERQFGPAAAAALAAQASRSAGYGAGVAARAGVGGLPTLALSVREGQRVSAFLAQTRFLSVARADLGVLAGVFELERGNPAGAAARFRAALALYAPARGTAPNLPGEPLARRYLDLIERRR